MIKGYNTFINELVKNPTNIDFISKSISNKLSNVVEVVEVYPGKYEHAHYYRIEFKYPSKIKRDNTDNKIKKILDIEQMKLSKNGIALSYQIERGKSFTLMEDMIRIYLKDLYTLRVTPSRFVFHTSDVSRDIIEKEGLKTKSHKTGNYKEQIDLYYPPAIFATNNNDTWQGKANKHIYVIDTREINNKWWYDINLYQSYNGIPKAKEDQTNAIMTFEDIPPEAIDFYS